MSPALPQLPDSSLAFLHEGNAQDLTVDLRRMPAVPRSGVVLGPR